MLDGPLAEILLEVAQALEPLRRPGECLGATARRCAGELWTERAENRRLREELRAASAELAAALATNRLPRRN